MIRRVRRKWAGLGCGLVVSATSASASAHVDLLEPSPRLAGSEGGIQLKNGPCGQTANARTDNVTVYEPGSTITVRWEEYLDHPSYYRVAFDVDGDDDFPVRSDMDAVDPSRDDPEAENPIGQVVLAYLYEDVPQSVYEMDVTLPDVECDNCTLQLIQFMYDKVGNRQDDEYYFQCADIVLEYSEAPGEGGAGGASGAAGGVRLPQGGTSPGAAGMGADSGGTTAAGGAGLGGQWLDQGGSAGASLSSGGAEALGGASAGGATFGTGGAEAPAGGSTATLGGAGGSLVNGTGGSPLGSGGASMGGSPVGERSAGGAGGTPGTTALGGMSTVPATGAQPGTATGGGESGPVAGEAPGGGGSSCAVSAPRRLGATGALWGFALTLLGLAHRRRLQRRER